MANRTNRTPIKDDLFVEALAQTGNVGAAAKAAGYGRSHIYERRKTDAAFAQAWDEARTMYVEALEAEADRRGRKGTLKPVFHKGIVCGTIRQYSDTLLMFRLKALKPEMYRDKFIQLQPPAEAAGASPKPKSGIISPEDIRQIKREVYGIYDDDDDDAEVDPT